MDLLIDILGTLFLILYTALTAAVMAAIVIFAFQRDFWMSGASGFLALILIGLALVAAASMMTDKITLEAADWQCLKQQPLAGRQGFRTIHEHGTRVRGVCEEREGLK